MQPGIKHAVANLFVPRIAHDPDVIASYAKLVTKTVEATARAGGVEIDSFGLPSVRSTVLETGFGETVRSIDCSLIYSPSPPDPPGFLALDSPPGKSTLRFLGGGAKALSLTLFMRSIMLPMPVFSEEAESPCPGVLAESSGEANENDSDG